MSDIRLFRIDQGKATAIDGSASHLEKPLQILIETNLESLLGIRFVASEYSTGKTHAGRIDTLGLDENHCPAILEYKRSPGENVINQGLFYLDWLMDHQAEFKLLVLEKFGKEAAAAIDWTAPRLICIAADFTKYDGRSFPTAANSTTTTYDEGRSRKIPQARWLRHALLGGMRPSRQRRPPTRRQGTKLHDDPAVPVKILLYGPPGVGKTSIADMVADALSGTRFQSIMLAAPSTEEIATMPRRHWPVDGQTSLRIAVGSGGCVRAALADLESSLDAEGLS